MGRHPLVKTRTDIGAQRARSALELPVTFPEHELAAWTSHGRNGKPTPREIKRAGVL
jgi:hypothetical protein